MDRSKPAKLPTSVKPLLYKVHLAPDAATSEFRGQETVHLQVSEPTHQIQLNSKNIDILKVEVHDGGDVVPVQSISYDEVYMVHTFTFGKTFERSVDASQPLQLLIEFTGRLDADMAGFYSSEYTDPFDRTQSVMSTQFETIYCRQCFPCWDEPAVKSQFLISLDVPVEHECLGNMPIANQETISTTTKRVTFCESPLMSTYLVALCVGRFDHVSEVTKSGTVVSVYTPLGRAAEGKFALDVAVKSLEYYDEFFQVPYPLPKLDMVAIPQFAAGAMENWGLVTFRERDMLINPAIASNEQKQRVAIVVTHELAHQWYGNLVTMDWWDDLWLNEGFAMWMENHMANVLFPDWRMWDQHAAVDQAVAFNLDGMRSSHPIKVPIHNATEAEEVFDSISYRKGSCLVRMAQGVVGVEQFREGMRGYMAKHKYSNTITDDLWNALEESSSVPIGKLMHQWVNQMGYPLVKIVRREQNATHTAFHLEQQWFLSDGSTPDRSEYEPWVVPIVTNASNQLHLMEGTEYQLSIPNEQLEKLPFLAFNFGRNAMFRTQYTEEMFDELFTAIPSGLLPPVDRAGLLDDVRALVMSRHLAPRILFKALRALGNETDAVVWDAIERCVSALHHLLAEFPAAKQGFTELVVSVFGAAVGRLLAAGNESKEQSSNHLQALLAGNLAKLCATIPELNADFVANAQRATQEFLQGNTSAIAPDVRVPTMQAAAATAAAAGDTSMFDAFRSHFEQLKDDSIRKDVLRAIGAVGQKEAVLDWCNSDAVKLQDFFYPIFSVSLSSPAGRETAWNYFKTNFDKIHQRIEKVPIMFTEVVIEASCGAFTTVEKQQDITEFFKQHPMPLVQRKLAQILESIGNRAKVLEQFRDAGLLDQQSAWSEF